MLTALKTYREQNKVTLAALAAQIGCTIPALSRIENGKRQASPALAKRLIAATGGAVTAADILHAPDQPSTPASEGAAA